MLRVDELHHRVTEHYAGPVAPLHRLGAVERQRIARWCDAMDAHKLADGDGPIAPPASVIGGWPVSDPPPLPTVPRPCSRMPARRRGPVRALAAATLVALVAGCGQEPEALVKWRPVDAAVDAGDAGHRPGAEGQADTRDAADCEVR